MKAIQINSYGGTEVLETAEIETPLPKEGQILVEVHSASLNPFDDKILSGMYKDMIPLEFPYTLGSDFSGIVTKLGVGVTDFKIGDEVFGSASALSGGSGSFAEKALAKVSSVYKKPRSLSFEGAASLVLVGVSALQALEEHIKLSNGQRVLIHGGAGGIGHIAIQLAKAIGAYCATTVSGNDIEFAKKLGADEVIDYKLKSFEKVLKDFDAVYDTVGGKTTEKSFEVLKKGGTLVSMLGEPNGNLAKKYEVSAIGQSTKVNTERLKRLTKYIDNGKVKVNIDKVFPLDQTKEAFTYFEKESPRGKVVLKIK